MRIFDEDEIGVKEKQTREHLGRGEIHTHTTYQGIGCFEPPVQGLLTPFYAGEANDHL